MDRQQLINRQKELEAQFNELRSATDNMRGQIEKNELELTKLQGAYAEIGKLLDSLTADNPKVPGTIPPANVINAESEAGSETTPEEAHNATKRPKG